MRKTKKIPIFLASLTLFATALGKNLSVVAVGGVSQNLIEVARGVADDFSLKINDTDAYLKMNLIKYKDGMASGTVSVPEDGDWYIKRIIVAYMNFNQGVSEEEADANLATLNEVNNDNWVVVSKYENYVWTERRTQDITLNRAQTGKDVFANKSDILYFAVEFGTITDEKWGETQWSRGKIDYRACVHSSVFDEEMMNCARVDYDGAGKYVPQMKSNGTLVDVPENEEVITWKEEWRDVILARYEAVQNESEVMWGYLNSGLMTLSQNDLILDGVLKSVRHYDVADSKLLWLPQGVEFQKGRIAEMKTFYEKSDGADTSKLEILEKENEVLKQANTILESEKEKLVMENEILVREKEELGQEILRLQAENEALRGMRDDFGQENEAEMSEIKSLRQEIERMTEEMMKMQQKADELVTEKMEIEAKNAGLQRDIDGVENVKQELERKLAEMTNGQKCGNVNVVTEVGVVDNGNDKMTVGQDEDMVGQEEAENEDDYDGVVIPNLGGEEVKTGGVWWWLIPVVGLAGVMILYIRRKLYRE